jgi:hypothetical protein
LGSAERNVSFADLESIHRATGWLPIESIRRAIESYLEEQKEAVKAGPERWRSGREDEGLPPYP